MDGVIRGIENMDLNAFGINGFEEEKRNILRQIRAAQPDFNYESIEGITVDDIEEFNAEILNITRTLQEAYQNYGKHGALDCGIRYVYYGNIRRAFQELNEDIHEGRSYTLTLRFIISSMVALPEVNVIRPLDKRRGERTFSKMCLNLAAQLLLARSNWVEGYWTKKQNADFI